MTTTFTPGQHITTSYLAGQIVKFPYRYFTNEVGTVTQVADDKVRVSWSDAGDGYWYTIDWAADNFTDDPRPRRSADGDDRAIDWQTYSDTTYARKILVTRAGEYGLSVGGLHGYRVDDWDEFAKLLGMLAARPKHA